MPDISMCQGSGKPWGEQFTSEEDCPKKENCYRYKAKPSEFRQAYFLGLPYDPVTGDCRHFLPMYKKEAVDALDDSVTEDVGKILKDQSHEPSS